MIPKSWFLAAATLLLAAACSSSPDRAEMRDAGSRPLTVDAWGTSASVSAERPLAPEEFLERVDRALRGGRRASAERFIRRHPDVAQQALSGTPRLSSVALPSVARVHERQCGTGAGGWVDLLNDRAEHVERYEEFDRERETRLRLLREGRFLEASEISDSVVPESSPAAALLRIEIRRLRGLALLLAERPGDAAEAFRSAVEPAKVSRPFEAAHLLLLLGEAEQRAGRPDAGASAWKEAVERAAGLSDEPMEIFDPGFWERSIHLRPPTSPWPAKVIAMVRRLSDRRLGARPAEGSTPEAALWGVIGSVRFQRGEIRSALMAFSRGGAPTSDPTIREALRLGQARALARQGEVAAAKALLAPAAGRAEAEASGPALGFLGALELRSGDTARALLILKKAIEGPEWPGRADAEANLGLAFLTTGKEADGLQWLHAAQARFETEGDADGRAQSLRNELRYLEERGRTKEAGDIRERLRVLEE